MIKDYVNESDNATLRSEMSNLFKITTGFTNAMSEVYFKYVIQNYYAEMRLESMKEGEDESFKLFKIPAEMRKIKKAMEVIMDEKEILKVFTEAIYELLKIDDWNVLNAAFGNGSLDSLGIKYERKEVKGS